MPTHMPSNANAPHLVTVTFSVACLVTVLPCFGSEADEVPGVVIDYQAAETGKYIGSPSIAVLPNGDYVASHDIFGPKSRFNRTRIFGSSDDGQSWQHLSDVVGAFWSTLFAHQDALYLIGAKERYGDTVIRRSDDGGRTWTTPKDSQTGILLTDQRYHCAPQPVLFHEGRIWRAMEDAGGPGGWAKHFRAFMMSAPLDADLLKADSWTVSNRVATKPGWLDGKFNGWLEGNAVATPDGGVANILRVDVPTGGGKATLIRVGDVGETSSFNPESGFLDMPGGSVKFTIRFDPKSKYYWALANAIPGRHLGQRNPGSTRNTLALIRSADLHSWEVRSYVAYHPDVRHHGFQYPDWQFKGNDIVGVSRTAYDDDKGGAHNFHDANYLTFHRVVDFRNVQDLELPPMPPPKPVVGECPGFVVEGFDFFVTRFDEDAVAYGNRGYLWKGVPERFCGWRFTRTEGGLHATIKVTAKRDTVVYAATAPTQEGTDTTGWRPVDDQSFCYTSAGKTRLTVFQRSLKPGEEILIPQTNWSGMIVLLPPE